MFSTDPFAPTLTADQFGHAAQMLRPALLEQALLQCRLDDAQDCVCEAITQALFNLARFRVRGDPRCTGFVPAHDWRSDLAHWLRRILANVIAGFFRKQTRRGETVFAEEFHQEAGEDMQETREKAQALALHDELYRRLGETPLTPLQDACTRRWMGGETQRAIGEELGISARMVGYHIEAAARRMRKAGDLEISRDMWLLFVDCAAHAKYTKPTGIWPDWMLQHPPDINLSAWIRKAQARKEAA